MHELDAPTQVKNSQADLPCRVEEGMVLQLADGTIEACNAAAAKILGLTTEQIRSWSGTMELIFRLKSIQQRSLCPPDNPSLML
jgi:PAS domain-containing protein